MMNALLRRAWRSALVWSALASTGCDIDDCEGLNKESGASLRLLRLCAAGGDPHPRPGEPTVPNGPVRSVDAGTPAHQAPPESVVGSSPGTEGAPQSAGTGELRGTTGDASGAADGRTSDAGVTMSDAATPVVGMDDGPEIDGADLGATLNDCCQPGVATCSDRAVVDCVCALDPMCCDERYDALCRLEAITSCDLVCPIPTPANDCCTTSLSPGCDESEIMACVCAVDPFCCDGRFDASCVSLATSTCGARCGGSDSACTNPPACEATATP